MNKNIDLYYNKHIKPLSKNERLTIVKKILDDMEENITREKRINEINAIKKLRGITKNADFTLSKEDWYKQ